jgi:phosphatidylglycerophosphate synthase
MLHLGWLRIIFAILAFYHSLTDHRVFLIAYAISYFLDAFDGMAARKFNQCNLKD